MRTNYLIYIGLSLIVMETACKKDWLDVKSNINQTVPITLQDFEYLLDDFIVMNQQTPGLAEVGSDGHYMLENRWQGTLSPVERNAYTWTNELPQLAVTDWNKSYQKIFQCNLVLDGLKKLDPNQEADKYNRIKGNALFHRAKNYYDLAQIYAQPYQAESATTDMGIALKEGVNVVTQSKRASVKATYEQILSDLHIAVRLLPVLGEVSTRGSKTGCYALMARTYMVMGDYNKSGLYADSSLTLYNKLLDFNNISASATNLGQFNIETIFFAQRTSSYLSTWNTGSYSVDPLLYNLYDNNDLRKTRFFTFSGANIIFKGNYNNSTVGFDGLAVDEQYLIRAECFARAGNIFGAMKDLNDLLKTRWNNTVVYPVRTATNAEDALKQVLLERKKELCFRNLRWTDLRRLNADPRFRVTLTRTIGEILIPLSQEVINIHFRFQMM